jgi:uncharacterized protein YutE (UPF0331/DUF86 family)
MMPVDGIRIRDLFGAMADAERMLGELSVLEEAEFLSDFRNTESAKYLLLVATEAAIDVCNHIASRRGGRAPRNYADCFAVLAELGVIDPELSGRLRRMARFRNLLVHRYWDLDNAQVYRTMREDLGDLETYRIQVAGWLGAR